MKLRVIGFCVGASLAFGPAGVGAQNAAQKTDAKTPAGETRLTRDQQKVLLGAIEATLKFASDDSKLALKRPVKGVFISRDDVNKVLRKKFDEDESTRRMERSELVLKKFGLLDRDFHLRPFLLSLLTEQIAGFYDNKTHGMNLLEWVPEEQQLPVMAHELTHALQDQRVNLDKWGDNEVKGVAKNVAEDNAHIRVDEMDTARGAVLEGQAMVTFADYALKASGKTLKDVPELAERLEAGAGDPAGSPVMARAPLVLQQSLLFPYVEGLAFETQMLVKKGTEFAFAGVLDAPPSSSFEILHPDLFLAHAVVPVMRLPDLHPMLEAEGYAPYDVGVMGELDVRMTTELFGGRALAEALAPNWDGGVYLAAQKKSAMAASAKDHDATSSLGLVYASRWKNEDSARSFFTVYDASLPREYSGLVRRTSDEKDEGERVYTTAEGDVLISLHDNLVFVGEGFSVTALRAMRAAIEAEQGTGAMKEAIASPQELTPGLGAWMGGFGVLRSGLVR